MRKLLFLLSVLTVLSCESYKEEDMVKTKIKVWRLVPKRGHIIGYDREVYRLMYNSEIDRLTVGDSVILSIPPNRSYYYIDSAIIHK